MENEEKQYLLESIGEFFENWLQRK
jgi:hypothetical protein